MLAILLGKSGVVSGMAGDGDEAVAMVQRDLAHFQMVFMDNMMPRMVSEWSTVLYVYSNLLYCTVHTVMHLVFIWSRYIDKSMIYLFCYLFITILLLLHEFIR